jgi:hypothetical protein
MKEEQDSELLKGLLRELFLFVRGSNYFQNGSWLVLKTRRMRTELSSSMVKWMVKGKVSMGFTRILS